MPKILRTFMLALALCGAVGLMISPAEAKPHHKKHHVVHHRSKKHRHAKKHVTHHSSTIVHSAQTHLTNLGYYKDKVDGLMGPKTATAVTNFQRDHHIHVNGKLTTETYNAIVTADVEKSKLQAEIAHEPVPPPPPAPDFYAKHPDFYGHYNQDYADPFITAPTVATNGAIPVVRSQTVPSRYAKIDVSENIHGPDRSYTVTMNGELFLIADDQPAVIGISRTFTLGTEDDVIFSTYRPNSSLCPYKHYLLTLHADGKTIQEIGNCTRGYQAKLIDNSLFVIFPESDDGRAVGNTWRYEPGDLERL